MILSTAGLVAIGFYLYVAAMCAYAEHKNDLPDTFTTLIIKPLMWPLTAWSSIQKLYESYPEA